MTKQSKQIAPGQAEFRGFRAIFSGILPADVRHNPAASDVIL